MNDPGVGRHHLEVGECLLPPAKKRVALPIAAVIQLHILLERQRGTERIHLNRVVDHQLHRL